MTSVVRILRSKPEQTVHTIAPTAMVLDALKLMAEKHRRAGGDGGRASLSGSSPSATMHTK